MGLSVDQARAKAILADAVEWAVSDRSVPRKWTDWTRRIDESPSKTFTVALGTALLAKATNPAVDALALKATSGDDAYSARSVAHGVLVPGAVEHGYDLRATGREPLNNQPFFRYDRIDEIDRIHASARPYLPELIAAGEAINVLSSRQAKAALAAFLRVRIAAANERQAIDLRGSGLSMTDLVEKTEAFVIEDPEEGRRGQAFVAAAFDLVHDGVRSSRVNDPSRRMPGDVQLLERGAPVLAIEVRQKAVSQQDTMHFAEALRKGGVAAGLVAMLDPGQEDLDEQAVMEDAERVCGVFVSLAYGVSELLIQASVWSGLPLEGVLTDFPLHMLARLEEIEASEPALRAWGALFPEQ